VELAIDISFVRSKVNAHLEIEGSTSGRFSDL
jgi:hypothetical protein